MKKKIKQIDASAIIARVRRLRTRHAGPRGRSTFARELGISPSTYNYYETTRVPPIGVLVRICELTGADLNWLLTGDVADEKLSLGPNAAVLRKLDELLNRTPEMAGPVTAFLELLGEKAGLEAEFRGRGHETSQPSRHGWIPVLGRTAAGLVQLWQDVLPADRATAITKLEKLVQKHTGSRIVGSVDGELSVDLKARELVAEVKRREANLVQVGGEDEGELVEFVDCEGLRRLYGDCFGLRIDGESMAPRINDGDVVIMSPSMRAGQGQAAVVRLRNQIGVTCKLIRTSGGKVHLIPINERYETKVVAKSEVLWALAVLCHVSV
jgi:transcriptional regulator with XRE-family HTH domain